MMRIQVEEMRWEERLGLEKQGGGKEYGKIRASLSWLQRKAEEAALKA